MSVKRDVLSGHAHSSLSLAVPTNSMHSAVLPSEGFGAGQDRVEIRSRIDFGALYRVRRWLTVELRAYGLRRCRPAAGLLSDWLSAFSNCAISSPQGPAWAEVTPRPSAIQTTSVIVDGFMTILQTSRCAAPVGRKR